MHCVCLSVHRRPSGRGRDALELIEQLNLQAETLVSSDAARSRYVMYKGRLERLPTSLVQAVTSPLTRPLAWDSLADLSVARHDAAVRCAPVRTDDMPM